MRSGLAWAAVVVVLATGCHEHWNGGSPENPTRAASARTTCTPAQLRLSAGPGIAPKTGQNPEAIRLTNTGLSCVLDGYPAVRFTDPADAAIPFRLLQSGDQMVTALGAHRVVVPEGGAAWVVLNKYRCDLGSHARVGEIELRLAGAGRIGAVGPNSAGWAFCGSGDPGSIVHISPFEPRLRDALRQH